MECPYCGKNYKCDKCKFEQHINTCPKRFEYLRQKKQEEQRKEMKRKEEENKIKREKTREKLKNYKEKKKQTKNKSTSGVIASSVNFTPKKVIAPLSIPKPKIIDIEDSISIISINKKHHKKRSKKSKNVDGLDSDMERELQKTLKKMNYILV